ncbi:hypothetical protein [Paenibacillus turpanensis]|uniref:hypothetical protein n=1 Tax=Paenibacillus turpanensis TaxID=2689078 RepID=UPI00140E66CD|nr:hypothetical protein [Paenibacillus turpanensis]
MNHWKKTALTVALSTSLLVTAAPFALANEALQTTAAIFNTTHNLNEQLQVQVKALYNERTSDGVRIAAVVKVNNAANKITRIPTYELRVKTADGVEYTLAGSTTNERSVKPRSQSELSYYTMIDSTEPVEIVELQWVDVDWYTYPKTETVKLSLPVAGSAWTGFDGENQVPVHKWGESFTIPGSRSPLKFTPVSYSKQLTGEKPATIVKVLVENPTAQRETVPEFTLYGRDNNQTFEGSRVEQSQVAVEPNEKKYIHFTIATEQETTLSSVSVMTPIQHVTAAGASSYQVGRLSLLLPQMTFGSNVTPTPYKLGEIIAVDELSKSINKDVDVSLVSLTLHENQGSGYKTAVAKFKLNNKNSKPVILPNFEAELQSTDGFSYSGVRQTISRTQMVPGLSNVVSYAFTLPASETGENLILKLQDSIGSYRTDVAAVKTSVVELRSDTELDLYPFKVKVDYMVPEMSYALTTGYSYKVKFDAVVTSDEKVIADQDNSLLTIEMIDRNGHVLAQEDVSLVGPTETQNQLITGKNTVSFTKLRTEQVETGTSYKIYEKVNTPNGPVKRLLTTLKGF